MRWCRFHSGHKVAYGLVEKNAVTEVSGSPFESHTRTSTTVPLSAVKLLVPVIPPTFYAAGVNYREHVTEMAHLRGVKPEFPAHADVGYRANNALVATDEPIVIPRDATEQVQYEGELVAVIGKRPGDVLWMGTDGATENMKDGDVVEVEVTDIGVLRNPVVRER